MASFPQKATGRGFPSGPVAGPFMARGRGTQPAGFVARGGGGGGRGRGSFQPRENQDSIVLAPAKASPARMSGFRNEEGGAIIDSQTFNWPGKLYSRELLIKISKREPALMRPPDMPSLFIR